MLSLCFLSSRNDDFAQTPFHEAAWYNRLRALRVMHHVAPSGLAMATSDNRTPIHNVAWCGHFAMMQWLVHVHPRGLQEVDEEMRSPLHIAAQRHHQLELIIVMSRAFPEGLREIDGEECTPLHVAAMEGNMPVVQWIIESGLSPEGLLDIDDRQMTPMHYVASFITAQNQGTTPYRDSTLELTYRQVAEAMMGRFERLRREGACSLIAREGHETLSRAVKEMLELRQTTPLSAARS